MHHYFVRSTENRKAEYYQVLRKCQAQRPGEDVTPWINFFLDALKNIGAQLLKKLESQGSQSQLSPREKSVLVFIGDHPGCKSGEIAAKLAIPNPTVKRILADLSARSLVEKHGSGPGTNYSVK